ncbi:endonuclease/exonuclease/phosphatase family protein [Plantactinospora sp. S1510]|uniref:Endonuclease/exonuclease/phosphatase family protein n=1 Tax=Plantactinospora alkalitolerans TaxID=2789879 RepID=A0ABS0GRB2_9ACTN|nr:endonuclease/exonuclease/phosphatase family protein [Plantactinospora alkalitolerans]MBF9128728.1 endonuclease/exonuclease/phosphatase family protein [Plantactinospora alkalitolerans]
MRILTWNVWWRFGGAWQEREQGIVQTLERVGPDVVGLVETWAGDGTTQVRRLADRLGMATAVFAPTSLPPPPDPVEEPTQAGIGMGIGLLSRWPLLAAEIHDLPCAQRAGRPPTALLAVLDHPHGPLRVIVACIEWEPGYAADQLAQSHALATIAADPRLDGDLPVLLVGDLNAAVEQSDLAPLLDVLIDTWTLGGGDPDGVTLSSSVPDAPLEATKQIDRRIDHVLARPGRTGGTLAVRRAFLAGDQPVNGRYPSDHFAVVVDLDI